jgi:hypothetical protein
MHLYIFTIFFAVDFPHGAFLARVKKNWLNYTTCLFTGGIFKDFWGKKMKIGFVSPTPAPKIFYFSNNGF